MEEGEAKIRQEDCNEDNLGQGVLTLTNKRVAFDKTRGRIMDFAKKFGDTVLDVQLDKITKVWKEGFIIKKVCITADTTDGQKTFKFGVLGTGSWLKSIQNAKDFVSNWC